VISVKDATRIVEECRSINGKVRKITFPIFEKDELERAETIVSALEGLTIESAQILLERINQYLLQDVIS
jgi:hypothetical protein